MWLVFFVAKSMMFKPTYVFLLRLAAADSDYVVDGYNESHKLSSLTSM
jgi:hypothetical protein